MANATPTKLRSGAWGAKVSGSVRAGDQIQITTKSGKSWTATVSKVVWSGKDVSIVATDSDRPAVRSAGRTRRNGAYGGRVDCRRYGWDGVVGSSSYYTSGQYDEDS